MRNFIQFVIKYHFFLIFLGLLLISFTLLFQFNLHHRSSFLNSANSVSGYINTKKENLVDYLDLREQNDELAKENAVLRSRMLDSYINLSNNRVLIKDSIRMQQYGYFEARVINNSTNRRNNYITINKGRSSGVAPDMGVLCQQGVVGWVEHVTDNYASVVSVLNNKFTVSAKLSGNNYFGLLKWEGIDPETALLRDIPKHAEVTLGDTVVTMGNSGFFPAGVPVGVVKEVTPHTSGNHHNIYVTLTTNFSNLSRVYVVDNYLKKEQLELEAQNDYAE